MLVPWELWGLGVDGWGGVSGCGLLCVCVRVRGLTAQSGAPPHHWEAAAAAAPPLLVRVASVRAFIFVCGCAVPVVRYWRVVKVQGIKTLG